MTDHTLEKCSPQVRYMSLRDGQSNQMWGEQIGTQIHLFFSSFFICMLMFILEYNLNLLVSLFTYT